MPSIRALLVGPGAGLLLALGTTGPAAAGDPWSSPDYHDALQRPSEGSRQRAADGFAVDLFRKGDFVRQVTKEYCVAAAVQMMLNVTREPNDPSSRTQHRLYARAVALSRSPYDDTNTTGWVASLEALRAGPYVETSFTTRGAAIHAASIAIRRTGRPAGLLTWRGAHSWVMTGFTATADPLEIGAEVTGVFVSDPWYPLVSTIWGPSHPPDTWLAVDDLSVDFLAWVPNERDPRYEGRYVVILPLPLRPLYGRVA